MKIHADIDWYVPTGFYCVKDGKNKCSRLNVYGTGQCYCELFYPILEKDYSGNVLKCDKCLLAERKARLNK